MTTKIALIRASASAQVGGGHIVRCMALARQLKQQGWSCKFISGPDTATTIPMVNEFDVMVIDENNPSTEAADIRRLTGQDVPVLIIDHYGRGLDFETQCRQWADRIVVISDMPSGSHDANLLLDQSGGRTFEQYSGLIPDACKLLLGPRYSLLRPQFSEHAVIDFKERASAPARVFISMGATDGNNLTAIALDAVNKVLPHTHVDIMLSTQAPHLAAIQDRCVKDDRLSLHVDSDNPADFIARATFAIGTAGINLWERCSLGIPSVMVIAAENQRDNANYVAAKGGGLLVGTRGILLAASGDLESAIEKIFYNQDDLNNMSKAAQDICDGKGAQRVADRITAMAAP